MGNHDTFVITSIKPNMNNDRFVEALKSLKALGLSYAPITKEWFGGLPDVEFQILAQLGGITYEVVTNEDDDMRVSHCPICGASINRIFDINKKPTGYYELITRRGQVHEHDGVKVTGKAVRDAKLKAKTPSPVDRDLGYAEAPVEAPKPIDPTPERSPDPAPRMASEDVRTMVSETLQELMPGTVGAALTMATQTLTSKIEAVATRVISDRLPVEHRVVVTGQGSEDRVIEGRPHKNFGKVLDALQLGFIPFLVGPAGSGKSDAASLAAEALGLEFEFTPFHADSGAADTLGYMDIRGEAIETAFKRAWRNGNTLWLGDEFDAGPGAHAVPLAEALKPGAKHCAFPDGKIAKGEGFYAMLGANTAGNGAEGGYMRNQIDAATRNRLVFIDWDYDEVAEFDWAGRDQSDWVRHVQRIRHASRKAGIETVIASVRASVMGAQYLRKLGDKYSYDQLDDMLIYQGCAPDDRKAIGKAMS